MKFIPIGLRDGSYKKKVTTLANLWWVKLRDGREFGFTDHDRKIVFDGIAYKPGLMTGTANQSSSDMDVDNLDIEGIVSHESITVDDVMGGIWDGAHVRFMRCDYTDPSLGVEIMRSGYTGEIEIDDSVPITDTHAAGAFRSEVRGLAQRLQQAQGMVYTPMCQHTFGEGICGRGVNKADHTITGAVESSYDGEVDAFFDSNRIDGIDGRWIDGLLTWTSGLNAGYKIRVKEADGGTVVLQEACPRLIADGDTYTLLKGCPKTREICHTRFGNVLYYFGFDLLPGRDEMQSPTITSA